MSVKGLVFSMRQYLGTVQPPATVLEDTSRYKSDGAFRADGQPDWEKTPKGIWVMDFNSANPDYVTIPANQTQLDFTSEDFSIIARVYVNSFAVSGQIFERGSINADGWGFSVYVNQNVWLRTNQASVNQTTFSAVTTLNVNTWCTLGASRSGASAVVYINGEIPTQTSGTHIDPLTSNRPAKIGIRDDLTTWPFDGKIAQLEIWNYALSEEQHAAIHYRLKQWG